MRGAAPPVDPPLSCVLWTGPQAGLSEVLGAVAQAAGGARREVVGP